MSQPDDFSNDDPVLPPPLDLSKWRGLPGKLMVIGGLITVAGFLYSWKHDGLVNFGFSWLVAFMFFLSLGLGSLFLVLAHHLFDAGWSVATRRMCEHMASLLFPCLAILFIPIALLAPRIYSWMGPVLQKTPDHALHAKFPLFTTTGFYVVAVACFAVWWLLTNRLKFWSLKQDETGSAECTQRMRFHSYWGIWLFAVCVVSS